MAITLELTPEIEAQLISQAEANGLSLPAYIEELVAKDCRSTAQPREAMSPEEIARSRARIEEIVEEFGRLPVLDSRTPDEIIGCDDFGLPTG